MRTDKETFLQLLQENRGIIFKVCNTYCSSKSDKDDLAQEIIFNLWKAFSTYEPHYKFSTWMYRIALNVAISFYRKEIRALSFKAYSEEIITINTTPEIETEADPNLDLLQQFIQELSEIDKSVILLYLDEKSYKEIAEITGITETNVATKINRIKKKLKSKF